MIGVDPRANRSAVPCSHVRLDRIAFSYARRQNWLRDPSLPPVFTVYPPRQASASVNAPIFALVSMAYCPRRVPCPNRVGW